MYRGDKVEHRPADKDVRIFELNMRKKAGIYPAFQYFIVEPLFALFVLLIPLFEIS